MNSRNATYFRKWASVHPVFLNDTVNETENETVLVSQLSKKQQIILVQLF